ncbi:MAG TPA: hypothetical protein VN936_10030 [Candidatus Acidoferrum sp.]|nr:hypothetical protein [Candidatus Acidoferrum sp.]
MPHRRRFAIARLAATVLATALVVNAAGTATASSAPGHAQMTRYTGAPDLSLTSAVVAAGGGAKHFSSLALLARLTGPAQGAEVARLTQRFGKANVATFVTTFDRSIHDALKTATAAGVSLPKPPAYLKDGGHLSAALLRAGTMGNGRFDVGYMLEHLVSRNIHVAIMHQLDDDPSVGYQRNAEFHEMLTAVMMDLKSQYGL